MSVSSELLGKKLEAYGKKIPGLGLYASVLLPVIALLQFFLLVVEFQTLSWIWPFFVLNSLVFVLCVAAFFALRKYNAFGYWCNLAFLVSLLVAKVAFDAWVLFEVATNKGLGVVTYTQGPGYIAISSLEAPPSAFTIIFEILLLAAAVFYLVVFLRNRKFFFTEVPA